LPAEIRCVAIKGEVSVLMIEAATIVLTVSALIRCISEGSILGQREPSWLVDGGARSPNEKIFYFLS
jgi:hypothetical protein